MIRGYTLGIVSLMFSLSISAAENGGDILAEWQGITVTTEDVERYMAFHLPPEETAQALSKPGAIERYITNLLMIRKASEEAQEQDVGLDDKQLQWQLEYQKDRWYTEAIKENLAESALKEGSWDIRAREKYLGDGDKYIRPARANASHILVKTAARSDEEVTSVLAEIESKLEEGADFSELAKRYSDDTGSAVKGGDLGWFTRERMVPEFSAAAFNMEKGEISEPIKSQFGYHIIQLNDKEPERKLPFEQVKSEIVADVKKQAAADAIKTYLEQMRGEAMSVKPDLEVMNEFRAKYDLDAYDEVPSGINER